MYDPILICSCVMSYQPLTLVLPRSSVPPAVQSHPLTGALRFPSDIDSAERSNSPEHNGKRTTYVCRQILFLFRRSNLKAVL